MIDDAAELLTLPEAAKLLPGSVHASTVWRWASRGIRGIRLRTTAVGGRRFVAQSAIDDFLRELNRSPDEQAAPPSVRTPRERRRAEAAAATRLDRAGIGVQRKRGRGQGK